MFYNVQELKDLIDLDGQKYQHKTLLENDDKSTSVCLVALKKDEIIDTHTSDNNTMIYVIDGEIEMHFEAEKYELKKGETMAFHKDREHKVLANKDTKFMLIKL